MVPPEDDGVDVEVAEVAGTDAGASGMPALPQLVRATPNPATAAATATPRIPTKTPDDG